MSGFNPTEKELDKLIFEAKDAFKKYDYPISEKLVEKLKAEYRANAEQKGNSWRNNCSLHFLENKLEEEMQEITVEYDALCHRSGNASWDKIAEECLDLILVASMLHERITQT